MDGSSGRLRASQHKFSEKGAAVAHPDLEAEQSHLDHAYRCLAAMRERTEATVSIDDMAAQAVDGEIARWHLQQRLRGLDVDVPGLAFGRIDEEGTPKVPGPTWYVGRRHVEDERGEPVVVDWRAGVSTSRSARTSCCNPTSSSRTWDWSSSTRSTGSASGKRNC